MRVRISFPAAARSEPVTGRVYVAIAREGEVTAPRRGGQAGPIGSAGSTGVPLFGRNVENLRPGAIAEIDGAVFGLEDVITLEFDVDKKETVGVRIDRKRRQSVTVLLKALGWTEEQILDLFDGAKSIQATLEKDHFTTPEEALEDIYRKLRPGEPPSAESARTLLENLFFNPKRYDLAKVGRHKVDKKLGPAQGELLKQLPIAPAARP